MHAPHTAMADLELRIGHRKSPSPVNPRPQSTHMRWTRPGYNPSSPKRSRYDKLEKPHVRVNNQPSLLLRMDAGASNPPKSGLMDHGHRRPIVKPLSERIAPDSADGIGTGTVALGSHRVEPPVDHEVTAEWRLSRNHKINGGSPHKGNICGVVEQDKSLSKSPASLGHQSSTQELQPPSSAPPQGLHPSLAESSRLNPLNRLRGAYPPDMFPINDFDVTWGAMPGSPSAEGSKPRYPQWDNLDLPPSKLLLVDRIGPLVVQNANRRLMSDQSATDNSQRAPSTSIDHHNVEAVLTSDVCASILSSALVAGQQYAEMKRNEPCPGGTHPISEEQSMKCFAIKPPDVTCSPQEENPIPRSSSPEGRIQGGSMPSFGFPFSSAVTADENGGQSMNKTIPRNASASNATVGPSVASAPAPTGSSVPISIPLSPAFFIHPVSPHDPTASSSKAYTYGSPDKNRRPLDHDYKSTQNFSPSLPTHPRKRYPSRSPSSHRHNDRYNDWNRGGPSYSPSSFYRRHSPSSPTLSAPHQRPEFSPRTSLRSKSPRSRRSRSPEPRLSRSPPSRQPSQYHMRGNGHYRRSSYRQQSPPPRGAHLSCRDYPYPPRTGKGSSGAEYPPIFPLPMSEKQFPDRTRSRESHLSTGIRSRHDSERSKRDDERGRERFRTPIHQQNADSGVADSSMTPAPKPASVTSLEPVTDSLYHAQVNEYSNVVVATTPAADPLLSQDTRESEEAVARESFHNVPGLWFMAEALDTPDVFEYPFEVSRNTALSWCLPLLLDIGESKSNSGERSAEIKRKLLPTVSLKLKCLPAELVHVARDKLEECKDVTQALSEIPCKWPPQGKLIIEVNPDQTTRKTVLPKDLGDSTLPYVELNMLVHEGPNLVRFIQLGNLSKYVFILHATPITSPCLTDGEAQEGIDHEKLEYDPSMTSIQGLLVKSQTNAKQTTPFLRVQNLTVKPLTFNSDATRVTNAS